ncbi:arginine--tRNA ligase [Ilyomonas limi]|uniref:Arginine--tRNA ligase n=1 Tax=Ilyomonas limi TaxID=2575867 RepID=A0A4U3KUS5_9BACT|nr:arginine--tRNA ligase [Ilyomonas limi]TKK64777.1 arginine--tRNA ligase [Ilyomonas limi]
MSIVTDIKKAAAKALQALYNVNINEADVLVNSTKPEFDGDYTIVLFAFVKQLRKSPEILGKEIGDYLMANELQLFSRFNVIKGFLNLTIKDTYWLHFLSSQYNNAAYGVQAHNGTRVMVEYSSPNTNKPLHLGHLRNNFLGWSTAEILKASGNEVVKTCVVNDRGIHISKSMIAWQWFGNGATPENTGIKGDHLVGDYYVMFNNEYKKEVEQLISKGASKEEAEQQAPIMEAARQMLVDWEKGKPEVRDLWQKMNSWVYKGFDETYQRIGTDFDKVYYESNTYLLGKDLVEEGLQKGVFYRKEDNSVWVDLTADGLDEKVVQRKDGTSVYITQDIGLAEQKQKEYNIQQSIYVVGDEQNYHFKVLKLICQKLGLPSADGIHHLSYGMVELPTGKMKSREGTVVDADDLLDEMVKIAAQKTEELGKIKDFNEDELKELYNTIGIGALKFFILRVDPKKRMVFNPEESIDFHGFTAPFIQYTYARIKSILRKENSAIQAANTGNVLLPLEKELIVQAEQFPTIIAEAAEAYDPSKVAVYIYNYAKTFNSFYTEHSVTNAESAEKKNLRLQLCVLTAHIIKTGMCLLGIEVPERM